jgi:hypothetical protein
MALLWVLKNNSNSVILHSLSEVRLETLVAIRVNIAVFARIASDYTPLHPRRLSS